MIFWLMPIIVAVFWAGMNSLAQYQSAQNAPPTTQTAAQSQAASFVGYRNAVGSYVAANPAFTGSVPTSSLAPWLAPGQSLPNGAGNQVAATPSGNGRIIYSWAQTFPLQGANPGVTNAAAQLTGGDASIGLVAGTQWISPIYGVQALTVPAFVPDGDILSVVQTGS